MNQERAKEILAGYRPHKDAATDPEFALALALLKRDPELALWFEREQALDAALRRELQGIPVPVGLQSRILSNRPSRPAQAVWWRLPSVLSAAAALLLVAGTWVAWRPPWGPGTWSDYQAYAVEEVTEPYAFDIKTRDQDQVRKKMAAAGYPSDYRLPPGLVEYPLEGGRVLRWRGHKVSVVCFGSDEEHKPDVWLIVRDRTPLSGAPAAAAPRFGTIGKARVASWADESHFYVIATTEGPDLKGLF